jgi:hypothetical protein
MLSLEEISTDNIKRSPRLHKKNVALASTYIKKLKELLEEGGKIKINDRVLDEAGKEELYNAKVMALYKVYDYIEPKWRNILPYLRAKANFYNSVLSCGKAIKKSCYFKEATLGAKIMNKFERILYSSAKQVRDHIIQKWMQNNWVQAYALNRVLKERNIPSDIYGYILEFYGDYKQILKV